MDCKKAESPHGSGLSAEIWISPDFLKQGNGGAASLTFVIASLIFPSFLLIWFCKLPPKLPQDILVAK